MILIRRPWTMQPQTPCPIVRNLLTNGLYEVFVATNERGPIFDDNITFSATRSLYFVPGVSALGRYVGKGNNNQATSVKTRRQQTFSASQSSSRLVAITPQIAPTAIAGVVKSGTYQQPIAIGNGTNARICSAYQMSGGTLTAYISDTDDVVVGETYRVVSVYRNGVGFELYINGRFVGEYADTRNLAATDSSAAWMSFAGIGLGASWSRALTHDEALSLSANPWSIFAPQISFVPTSITASGTPTLTDPGWTISGNQFTPRGTYTF